MGVWTNNIRRYFGRSWTSKKNHSKNYATRIREHNAQLMRSWKAAEQSRLASAWVSTTTPINAKIRRHLTTLRARSRDQQMQNDYVRHYIRTVVNNVVGADGFSIQSQVQRLSGGPDKPANDAIEAAYKEAGRVVDITGQISRRDNYRLFLTSLIVDGEYIAIKHRGPGQGKYGYLLEVIDPELLDVNKYERLPNGNWVRMGIEYNRDNVPIKYWFKIYKPELETYANHEWRIIPADRVIHAFFIEFVGQERGVPWLATTLFSLKQSDAYDEAAIIAARIGASQMGFFSSDGGEGYQGDEKQEDGSTLVELEPGTFEDIGNKKLQVYDPNYPHEQYEPFKKSITRKMASGLGIQYETLNNDREGVNYTSIRHGTLEDRENWKIIQTFMIEQLVRPDREAWLEMAWLKGAIKIGRNPLARALEDYLPARYQGRRWEWVDPSKDMTAYEKELGMHAISVSEIIRRRGRDPDDVFAEIALDNEKIKTLVPNQGRPDNSPGENSEVDDLSKLANDYGVAVRSGLITPQIADEENFRDKMGLPQLSDEGRILWWKQENVRQPITLKQAGEAVEEAGADNPDETQEVIENDTGNETE